MAEVWSREDEVVDISWGASCCCLEGPGRKCGKSSLVLREDWKKRTTSMSKRALLVCALIWAAAAAPQGLPKDFTWGSLEGSLDYPVDFDFLPRGQTDRVLIAEKKGLVRLSINGVIQAEPFLDIIDRTTSYVGARGVTSIAVDVDFENNKYIYVLYSFEDSPGDPSGTKTGRLSRFRVRNNLMSANPDSETVLVGSLGPVRRFRQCTDEEMEEDRVCLSKSHLLGGLDMDDSGLLWVSFGDNSDNNNPGESTSHAQTLGSMTSKILRVDRDGRAPASNPFYDGNPLSNPSRTAALGLRNGFRIAYDNTRQALWVADVGWIRYEEVNFLKMGENYEWPCRQAFLDQFQFTSIVEQCEDLLNNVPKRNSRVIGKPTSPVIAYDRSVGSAITGIVPMLGSSWPEKYRNALFYVDYVKGWLKFNIMDSEGQSETGPFDFASNLEAPVQIREGSDGCLWYLSLLTQVVNKICYVEDTSLPEVLYVSPARGKRNVERNLPILITISKAVTEESALKSIVLTDTTNGAKVSGSTEYDEESLTIKFTPSTMLNARRKYRITVKNLEDRSGRIMAKNVHNAFTTTSGYTLYVSDLSLVTATSAGSRPVLLNAAMTSPVLAIGLNGVKYSKGLSVLPSGIIVAEIPSGCKRLQGIVGMDDASQGLEDLGVYLGILADGKWVFSSQNRLGGRRMVVGDKPLPFDIGVDSRLIVELRAKTNNQATSEDTIVSWADLKFRCGAYDAKQPRVVNVSPPDGARAVPLNPMALVAFNEAMDVRSFAAGVTITDMVTGLSIAWEVGSVNRFLTKIWIDTGSLEYRRSYQISFSAAVRDIHGNPLNSDSTAFVWNFRTEAEPVDPTSIGVVEELQIERIKHRGSMSTDGFPRTVMPGMETYSSGLWLKTPTEVVLDLTSLAQRDCSSLVAVIGADASIGGATAGKCAFSVSSELTPSSQVEFEVVAGPREISSEIIVPLRDGQTELALAAERSAGTDVRVECNFADAKILCADGAVPLSELAVKLPRPSEASFSVNGAPNGNPLRLLTEESTYESGLLAGAELIILFNIPDSSCTRFRSDLQIDTENSVNGAKMRVRGYVDDVEICRSAIFTYGGGPVPLDCDVAGASQLELKFGKQGSVSGDHIALFTRAYLDCDSTARRPRCDIEPISDGFAVDDRINFRAIAYSFAGFPLPASSIRWDVSLIHCSPECHAHPEQVLIGDVEGSLVVPNHGDYFYFQFDCVVEDEGLTGRSSATSRPSVVPVTVRSQPPGKRVVLGSVDGETPLSTDVVMASTFAVHVRREDPDDGYIFSHWAHDGSTELSFEYTLDSADPVSFRAVFVPGGSS